MASDIQVDKFIFDLSLIEQELNSKCTELINLILEKKHRMIKRISTMRQSYLCLLGSKHKPFYEAIFNFETKQIIDAIASCTINIRINVMKIPQVLPEICKPIPIESEEFRLPKELVVHDHSGKICVASSGNECVKECNASGIVINSIGYGELKEPYGLLIHSSLYVTDTSLNSIFLYDMIYKNDKFGPQIVPMIS